MSYYWMAIKNRGIYRFPIAENCFILNKSEFDDYFDEVNLINDKEKDFYFDLICSIDDIIRLLLVDPKKIIDQSKYKSITKHPRFKVDLSNFPETWNEFIGQKFDL